MELTETQSPQNKQKKSRWVIVILVIALLAAVAAIVFLVTREPKAPPPTQQGKIGYSEGAVLLDDSKPVEYTPPEAITLDYKGQAVSEDGKTFQCKIANAQENQYDMYIDIYADNALTDQLFLSELFRPGTGFEEITLNRALDPGTHTAYLVFTQVEEDQSTMHNQLVVTIDLVVK